MNATLARSGTTIDIPLRSDSGGTPLVATDWGKPNATVHSSGGSINPRAQDRWSGLENHTISGQFTSSTAYSDALDLADLIKSHGGNDALTLNIPMGEFDSDMIVAPAAGQEQALSVSYQPGRRDHVLVDVNLTRVHSTQGSDSAQQATTPTDSGSGPVEITANGNTVSPSSNLLVERTVGRPNDVIRRRSGDNLPSHYTKRKVAYDEFSLGFWLADANAVSDLQSLANNIFRQELGREGMTIDFNGIYGMGEMAVLPTGSAPFRSVRPSGFEGTIRCPTFSFRRIRR